jgi:hypothetical protein
MFVGKTRSLPKIGVPERCFTHVGSCLTCINWNRLESLVRYIHSSLFVSYVSYKENIVLPTQNLTTNGSHFKPRPEFISLGLHKHYLRPY